MVPPTAVSSSRLEALVESLDSALAEHDFELDWVVNEDGTRFATFKKGEVKIEYVLDVRADAKEPSYETKADVSLELKLQDDEGIVVIYDNGISSSHTTTEAVIAELVNGKKGTESEWPDQNSQYAQMVVVGLKGRLDEVLSETQIRYRITTSEPISVSEVARKLWEAYDPSKTVHLKFSPPSERLYLATAEGDEKVSFSVRVLDGGALGSAGRQFEVVVDGKSYLPEGLDTHRLHAAIKETAKALSGNS